MNKIMALSLEKEFITLALEINSYLEENYDNFNLKTSETELRVEFEKFLSSNNAIPTVRIGSAKKEVGLSFACEVLDDVIKAFEFKKRIMAVSVQSSSKIKTFNTINEYERNTLFLVDLEDTGDSFNIILQLNGFVSTMQNDKLKELSESTSIEDNYLLNEELEIDAILQKDIYHTHVENYRLRSNNDKIPVVSLYNYFTPTMVEKLSVRLASCNKDNYFTGYSSVEDYKTIYKGFEECCKYLEVEHVDIDYVSSMIEVDNKFYPVLLSLTKFKEVISVSAVIVRDGENDSFTQIKLIEIFSNKDVSLETILEIARKETRCIVRKK